MFSTRLLFLAVLISTVMAGPWVNICASKSSNEIRTCDSHGCGQYTAQRNRGAHQGVDVLCPDGSTVYAPFTGTIVGQEKPYKNKNAVNNGVRISGRGAIKLNVTCSNPVNNRHKPCPIPCHAHNRWHTWAHCCSHCGNPLG